MKKILYGMLISFVFALIFEIVGVWQAMVIAGILGGLMVNRSWQAFLVGFIGVAICWLIILIHAEIMYQIFPLTKITGQIMMLPASLSFLIFIGTFLIGGILGGLGGLNGLWWRRVFIK
jgi:membrane-bound acyltransferase YfiQ involved in biofilm formation